MTQPETTSLEKLRWVLVQYSALAPGSQDAIDGCLVALPRLKGYAVNPRDPIVKQVRRRLARRYHAEFGHLPT